MGNELDNPMDVELMAASLRSSAADLPLFLEVLASKLTNSLPTQTIITRHSSLFSRNHPIKEIKVMLGEYQYRLLQERSTPLLASRAKIVRGITLKTDALPLDQWIQEFATSLAQFAAESAIARSALERFLIEGA